MINNTNTPFLFAFRLMFRSVPLITVFMIISTVVLGVIPGLQAWFIKYLIDALTDSKFHEIVLMFIILSAISLIQILLMILNNIFSRLARNKVNFVSTELMQISAKAVPTIDFYNEDFQGKLSRAKSNVYSPFNLIESILVLCQLVIALITFIIFVFSLSAWLCIIFIFCICLY
ncbi:hypothetical protein, partial [Sutcliffiella rhizosphaerae]|uniref:hypothetical protein n=1 Tax=Sutcliffiella rhizosphaerae TaxID=2880967 RepID=UPI001E565ACC